MIYFFVTQFLIFLFLIGFAYWKMWNFEKSRIQLFVFCQTVQKEVIALKRALSKTQGEIFGNSFCQSCSNLLPENTMRTHDGKLYCADCKTKWFEKLERKSAPQHVNG